MTELSSYEFSTLREGEFILYRGSREGLDPILLVAPAGDYPVHQSLKRLEHEYSLRAELGRDWAALPVALTHRHDRPTLVLEDRGGEPLDCLIYQPLEMTAFLRIAIALAVALHQLHERGLIHKDIKPANVLAEIASGRVWLTGFGIASRLPREHQLPEPPEVIAGTLAYMAPEQTGRMNRSIDSRSDLYALGVTFYEMLTGALPFTAADPMEWVHCHIARQPVPPSDRMAAIPKQISAIVMKLLTKTAEERYQTAAGIETDLRRCLAQWERFGRIDEFALGKGDTSDRLLMPEKLYGREREIGALLASFARVVACGTPELVLVSGYSGIGKSSVVNELHRVLVPPRGLFASGKFDQYKRDIPYATLAQAFQSLVRPLLGKSEPELISWRNSIRQALGPNGRLIVNLVAELELIIGEQPPIPDLPPQDAQNRFHLVFRRFLSVFARPEHPLALFLDDLQWLDAATLDLLEDLLTQPDVRHLMLIGAYRDNEVNSVHPLMRKLEAIRKAGAIAQEMILSPLGHDDLGQLIADSLHCEPERAAPLAQLVHEKTAGNPFFVIQFVAALAEEELLTFDHDTAGWIWDLKRIHAKGYTDNVVDLMVSKLTRLPAKTQQALKQLGCMGNSAEFATLAMVFRDSLKEMHDDLWEAVRAGLVFRTEDSYRFLHDRVQEAAYSLIPKAERGAAHFRIGRLLASCTAPGQIEEKIFEIVNQFNRGSHLITSAEERNLVAELNLIAGRRAKASTAYASALTYLSAGRALLTEESWDERYDLIFALEFHTAECGLLTANLAAAEDRLSMLAQHAGNLLDIAAIARLRLTLYTTLDRSDRGVEVCLEYLKNASEYLQKGGFHWSPHPTKDEVRREYERIWSQLGSRSIEELVDLPLMSDPVCRATLDVLTEVVTPALFTDENLLALVICRMANLSLEYGNSDGSCFAYVWLGMILGPHFGDYQAGFRFGRLGYDLVEKRGLHRFQARAYMSFGNLVIPWTKHVQSGRNLVRRAFDAANRIGDLTFAAYSCNNLNTNLLATGDPLGDVQREAENGLAFARKARFGLVIDIISAQLKLIQTLRGLTPEFGSFNDEQFDESRFERHLQSDPRLALPECWYWIRKLQARFLAEEHSAAVEASLNAQRLLWTSPSFFEMAEYHFYGALARAACYGATPATAQPQHFEALLAHHRQLTVWAENCPENFGNRAALVAAEIARINGQDLEAMRLYEDAINLARQHGFIQNEGIAAERAARFYAARGFETIAHSYFRNARYCYLRWGADGKVRQIEQSYPQLRDEPKLTVSSAAFDELVAQLDVATVIKASQAVSGEILLDRLIETLMTIALEHAGAERGLLILKRGAAYRIEAEAGTGRKNVEVTLRQADVTASEMPESLLHTVIRTHKSVILEDAQRSDMFMADAYVQQRRPRSVLCLPLVKQTKLTGLLYLENNLAPGIFTPQRVVVLELLASQAAISLQNAQLYAELNAENRIRQQAEEDLRRSEASLTQAQEISHTGSWRWNVGTGEVTSSAELLRIFAVDPGDAKQSYSLFMDRVHPDDRPLFEQIIKRAIREKIDFAHDYRIVLPDGSFKFLQSFGQSLVNQSGELEYIGTVMDITERKRADEALRIAQAELARVTRLTMMGEFVASIAHEINQPLAAVVTSANAGLRWLDRDRPDLDKIRAGFSRIVSDGTRAGDVIRSLRALANKSQPQFAELDMDDTIQEVLALARSELQRQGVVLRMDLRAGNRPILGDRVQLQQVLLNLIMNGIESMTAVSDRSRLLTISSEFTETDCVQVGVKDTGTGIDPEAADRIFGAFYTTKSHGMGMGLSICRSIIEAHGGSIWATRNSETGSTFQFTVRARQETTS
jgi:predicted ATPase/signal transduction histidine kinase